MSEPLDDPVVDPVDDTEPWAQAILVQRWRSMTFKEKLELMSAHSVALQELSISGLRLRFPDASEEELALRAAALRIGVDEFARRTGHSFAW